MFRNLIRRGIPALVLILALAGAAPATAQTLHLDRWDDLWGWVVSLLSDEETGDGDRGPGLDPDGSTEEGDRGAGLDPNG